MVSPSDLSAFKASIKTLPIRFCTQSNYCTQANWLNRYVKADLSAMPEITDDEIERLVQAAPKSFFDTRSKRCQLRSIIRRFRAFKTTAMATTRPW